MIDILIFPERLKYRIFKEPVDLRNDVKGLGNLVYRHLGKPGKGEPIVFIFFNKKRNTVKILYYDGRGVHVHKNTLDTDLFSIPVIDKDQRIVDVDPLTMMALMSGMKVYAKTA
jgi:transposase